MHVLENRIPPPIICLLVALAMWGGTRSLPPYPVADEWRYGLAALVFAFGLVVGASGVRAFRRAKTTINPVDLQAASSLVTGGVFSLTRNPMYVGFTALLLSIAILLARPIAFLGPLIFFLFIWRFQIVPEERVMQEKFGTAFSEYRARVRRWL